MFQLLTYYLLCSILHLNLYYASEVNSCERQETCGECIRDPGVCVWCAHNDYNETRCKSRDSVNSDWCPGDLQNPIGLVHPADTGDHSFSSESGNVIQIQPQKYKILARRGEPVNFTFSYKGARDYPVDMYFLMDASKSMKKTQDDIAAQSESIYMTMKEFTNDVQMGMGSFIEKNALPFTERYGSDKEHKKVLMVGNKIQFESINTINSKRTTHSNLTYSFMHRLKLTKDFKHFQETVTATSFGTNRDNPDNALDALAQVIVCKNDIGWRTESRKFVFLFTNTVYHAAGDGRSAGIFEPFDGKCHVKNNLYSKETEMDYPSLPMINKLAVKNEVIVIFVVDTRHDTVYRDLSSVVSGSKIAHYNFKLQEKHTLVKIIKNIYKEITKTIKLKTDIKEENRKNVLISFNPDCKNQQLGECEVKKEEEKTFVGRLVTDEVNDFSFDVTIEGISERLTLDVKIIKGCPCEIRVENSEYCHGEPRQCGNCKCGSERFGDRCMCVRNKNNPQNDNSTCIKEGSKELCSGQGICLCGTCQCRDRYEGRYCECNKDSCPRDPVSGRICNGEGHGKCNCGSCVCTSGWSGRACDCTTSKADCVTRNDKLQYCNNRGDCNCGSCDCKPIAEWDKRRDQDILCKVLPCPECHSFQCRYLDNLVICNQGSKECINDNILITIEKNLSSDYLNSTEWNLCPDIKVDIGCYTRYVYKYDDENYEILVVLQEDKNCLESFLVFGGVFFLTLILIGLCTLLAWKILTEARDKMEYNNFIKQQNENNTGPIINPLYSPATTTFRNPAFRKQSIY